MMSSLLVTLNSMVQWQNETILHWQHWSRDHHSALDALQDTLIHFNSTMNSMVIQLQNNVSALQHGIDSVVTSFAVIGKILSPISFLVSVISWFLTSTAFWVSKIILPGPLSSLVQLLPVLSGTEVLVILILLLLSIIRKKRALVAPISSENSHVQPKKTIVASKSTAADEQLQLYLQWINQL
ncbi:hypothetical protein DM01DRAFT_159530 [Hesseltinella vesiculosa]|uniref:Uncharacterized protein n=1 Tax=Hesseltinella vesiculosa TaxID=101127 RepID=A0A1X2GKX6_9FUNG|nr:hypothetical protein DM01DRAFT_159530 [Hesseltinella vesiculosa]